VVTVFAAVSRILGSIYFYLGSLPVDFFRPLLDLPSSSIYSLLITLPLKFSSPVLSINDRERCDVLVAQLVEALRYIPAGRGFDSRWCQWIFH
jgi:hypothetical protein